MPKSKELSPEAAALRRAYRKRWNDANRDRIREYNRSYWERKAAAFRAAQKRGGNTE